MSNLEKRIMDLGYVLESAKPAIGNYLGSKRSGDILFAAARVSDQNGEVGTDITREVAKTAARDTVLRILAIVRQDIGDLDMIEGVIKMTGFVRSSPDFTEQPFVLDGASELLIELFGDAGKHARTATGVAQLPTGASVQLEIIFQLKQT